MRTPPPVPLPNILITGTPGTGKSAVAQALGRALNSLHGPVEAVQVIDIGQLVRSQPERFADEYDRERDCHVLDEDAILDYLEPLLAAGGKIVEHHSSEWFPERWFARVLALQCDSDELYARLAGRQYDERKVRENVEAEIMRVCVDEARASYAADVVCVVDNTRPWQRRRIIDDTVRWWKLRSAPDGTPPPAARSGSRGT